MDLTVVRGPVMDRGEARADPRKEKPSDSPIVLKAATATAVVKKLHPNGIRAPAIDNGFDYAGAKIDGLIPIHIGVSTDAK